MTKKLLKVLAIFTGLGMVLELLLIGHYESVYQSIAMAGLAIFFLALFIVKSRLWNRLLMTAIAIVGIVGLGFHLQSNWEFEKEMYPNLSGVDLFFETLTGALPILAPGAFISLALIGFIINQIESEQNETK